MSVVKELLDRKNQLIYGFLKKLDDLNINKDTHDIIRILFLDTINQLYRDSVFILAAKDGVIIQSAEVLAKQLLPDNFSIEKLVTQTKENLAKSSKKARKVKEIIEDASNGKV